MNDITPKEAIANLNHIYGFVAPDIQRSLDVAIKALESSQGYGISREALIREIGRTDEWYKGRSICDIIDNAPTVPLPNEQTAWEQGYEIGLAQGKHDRPKGKWQRHSDDYTVFYTCSKCNGYGYIRDKFCKHCGADMRGGLKAE